MKITYGAGSTEYGPGVEISLTGSEIATAISAYLVAQGIHVDGARTIFVNAELCETGRVYVDPSGFVIANGRRFSGRGPDYDKEKKYMRVGPITTLEIDTHVNGEDDDNN